jgi:hypothetical protein
MHKAIVLGVVVLSTACSGWFDAPEVSKCERYLVSKLDKPESYKRGRYDSLSLGKYWEVGIEFSYDDKSGTRVERAWQICDYALVNGKPDVSKFLKVSGSVGAP